MRVALAWVFPSGLAHPPSTAAPAVMSAPARNCARLSCRSIRLIVVAGQQCAANCPHTGDAAAAVKRVDYEL